MTDDDLTSELHDFGLEPDDLDGHTIDELTDYLDSNRTPTDPSIESSPGCQLVLQALERLRALSRALNDVDIATAPPPPDGWVERILGGIHLDARAGRRIPIEHPSTRADLAVTEGAVRGIIRAAESDVNGLITGRCRLEGEITTPGAPVTVSVDASILWGEPIPETAQRLRDAIATRLAAHTDLNVVSIDVTIHDIHHLAAKSEEES